MTRGLRTIALTLVLASIALPIRLGATPPAAPPLESTAIAESVIDEAAAQPDREELASAARDSLEADRRIAAGVAVALARAPAIPDVNVDVNAGVVTLSGSVVDERQRERAERLAAGVEDVREVDNQLQLSVDLVTRTRAASSETRDKLTRWIASAPLLLVAILVVLFASWLGRFASRNLGLLKLDARNPYLRQLIGRILQFAITVAGIVMALDLLGATRLAGALLGSAGVVGLALGFAFRDIAENYIAGIMLSLRRPFAPGDHVQIDGHEGRVVSLSARATVLMTLAGNHLRLPNALVFKAVILNFTHNPRRRFTVSTDIDSGESISEAEKVGLAAICGIEGVLDDPGPRMLARSFDSKGVGIEFHGWIDQTVSDFGRTASAAIYAVKKAFEDHDIENARSVQFVVHAGEDPRLESAKPRTDEKVEDIDTRRDTTIDAQLEQAQLQQADTNLIAGTRSREE